MSAVMGNAARQWQEYGRLHSQRDGIAHVIAAAVTRGDLDTAQVQAVDYGAITRQLDGLAFALSGDAAGERDDACTCGRSECGAC